MLLPPSGTYETLQVTFYTYILGFIFSGGCKHDIIREKVKVQER